MRISGLEKVGPSLFDTPMRMVSPERSTSAFHSFVSLNSMPLASDVGLVDPDSSVASVSPVDAGAVVAVPAPAAGPRRRSGVGRCRRVRCRRGLVGVIVAAACRCDQQQPREDQACLVAMSHMQIPPCRVMSSVRYVTHQ